MSSEVHTRNHPFKCPKNMHEKIAGYSQRLPKRYPLPRENGLLDKCLNLQVLAEGGDDAADGDTDGGQTQTGDESSNLRGQLDEQGRAVLLGDGQEVLSGARDVLEEVTDAGSGLDDGTSGDTDGGETKAAEESSNGGGELDEELLGVAAGNGEGALDLGSEVTDDVASGEVTLQVLAEGSNDSADGDTDGGETKTGDEASDLRGQTDEQSTDISTDNGDNTVEGRSKASDKVTQAAGGSNNTTKGNTETGETQAGDQSGNLRAQLDEQGLGVGASNSQDVVDLRAEVLNDVAGLANVLGGIGARGSGQVENLGEVTEVGDNGQAVQLELLGDVTKLEVLGDTLKTGKLGDVGQAAGQLGEVRQTSRGRGGDGSSGHGQEGDERGLHGDAIKRY